MIIYLIAVIGTLLGFFIGFVFREIEWSKEDFIKYFGRTAFVILVAAMIVNTVTLCKSYSTYVTARTQYDAIVNQYKGAVTLYTDHATLDLAKAALTDFKHQGYQENLAAIVKELRREIVDYNATLISKRVMKKNPFFSWVIVAPDSDMKIINIVE